MRLTLLICLLLLCSPTVHSVPVHSAPWTLSERTPTASDWGYSPQDLADSEVNPPNFSWMPEKNAVSWQVQCASDSAFENVSYNGDSIEYFVHTPPIAFDSGKYFWRYRARNAKGEWSQWSRVRAFAITNHSLVMPMPEREELLARIPDSHPRIFVRPEQLPRLQELASGTMSNDFDELVKSCEQLLKSPPPTAEPPKYGPDVDRKSEQWREIWWGNRTYTIRALDGAATLAFTRLLGGKDEYGQLAKRILLDCAAWDPKGATGYRYNDEAGMPYAYYFSRTYTFVNDLLSEEEKQICRDVMKIRGDEMFQHLSPRHLQSPYSSHSNRAWHFLGEIGIAFLGEIESADDWVWFAMNVFYNTYPVWSDQDGGWHEGMIYWNSYIQRFTWWADIMRTAMGVNAYDKPYFKRVGYYPMYLMPPGKVGGGFGDLNGERKSSSQVSLMSVLATQASNPYWMWYVSEHGQSGNQSGYVGFIRGAQQAVEPKPPTDLPSSRLFRGIGQAYLNTNLFDANENVQVVFKSSPFGTQSHGYEANNSFLLWAYGQRLLIRSGRRDIYGSEHHRDWMWSTRSVNNITVNGKGQLPHSSASQGSIVSFQTTPTIDVVVGEAAAAYRNGGDENDPSRLLDRFTRAIIFVKPDFVLVYDRLIAKEPSKFSYWLHAVNSFAADNQRDVLVSAGDVRCKIDFLMPANLVLSQTNQYDPNPRERVKLREWHLSADTSEPSKTIEFVTVYRPYRESAVAPDPTELETVTGGYLLRTRVEGGNVVAFLPTSDNAKIDQALLPISADADNIPAGQIVVSYFDSQGTPVKTVSAAMQ